MDKTIELVAVAAPIFFVRVVIKNIKISFEVCQDANFKIVCLVEVAGTQAGPNT